MTKTQRVGKALKGSIKLDLIRRIQASMPDGGKWCVWKAVLRENGDTGKEPHALRGGRLYRISSADVTQWVDFDTACGWLDFDGADGLGVLIGSNPKPTEKNPNPAPPYSTSGLVGVDIDKCLDEFGNFIDDGRPLTALAIEDMQKAGVYIERSPSGRGLRALWIGNKAQGFKEAENKREMYDSTSTRYLTITGDVWGVENPPTALVKQDVDFAYDIADSLELAEPEPSPEESGKYPPRNMSALSDAEIIQKIKQSRQGKSKKLFDGDLSEYTGDWSSADAGLCRAICHWTDDSAQVGRVWEASALAKRDKFKRNDYRTRTIAVALASARKSAAEGSNTEIASKEKLANALVAGDSGGALASALASWGGKPKPTLGCIERILSLDKRLAGAIAYDDFSSQVLKLRSLHDCLGDAVPRDVVPEHGDTWSDADDSAITVWLEVVWGISARSMLVREALDTVARRFRVNVVTDALDSLKWDGKQRLGKMLAEYFNADTKLDTARYLGSIGTCWMIGAVRRAYIPGTKCDHVLVLDGQQGKSKSASIKTLADAIAPRVFMENLTNLNNGEEAAMSLRGVWICEMAELSSLERSSIEQTKAFLTRTVDTYRPKHGRRSISVPRTVSFTATTNNSRFVKDSAARRFWTFSVTHEIDIKAIERDAPQLWAEAVALHKQGVPHWLTDMAVIREAEASQKQRLEQSGWDELIDVNVIDRLTDGTLAADGFCMQASEIWAIVNPDAVSEFVRNTKSFSDALTRVGFERRNHSGRSMWLIGTELSRHIRDIKLGIV